MKFFIISVHKQEGNHMMTGLEIMETCKEQDGCEKCPCKVECRKWLEKLQKAEPREVHDLIEKVV